MNLVSKWKSFNQTSGPYSLLIHNVQSRHLCFAILDVTYAGVDSYGNNTAFTSGSNGFYWLTAMSIS